MSLLFDFATKNLQLATILRILLISSPVMGLKIKLSSGRQGFTFLQEDNTRIKQEVIYSDMLTAIQ